MGVCMCACAGLVCPKVYVCGVTCMPLLGIPETTLSIMPSVAKGGGVSTGGQDNNYGNYLMGVCTIYWYRKYSTKAMPTPHVPKSGRVSTGGQGESGESNAVCA